MNRLLKNWFVLYSILACTAATLPLIIAAFFLRGNYPLLFHSILFLMGWVLWTWVEYHYHRFVLHYKTGRSKTSTSKSHHHHHTNPAQFETTSLRRSLFFIISCVFVCIAYRLDNFFTLFAGFFWGWTAFCFVHYLLHIKWTKAILPRHHEFHIEHHCNNKDKCFGVSVIWWDVLFGTAPEKKPATNNKILNFYYMK